MKYETFTEFEFVYLVLSLFPFHLFVWQIHVTYSSIKHAFSTHGAGCSTRSSPLELLRSVRFALISNCEFSFTPNWKWLNLCIYWAVMWKYIASLSHEGLQLFWNLSTQLFTTISTYKVLGPKETGEQLPYSFSTKQSTTTASAKFQLKKFFQFSRPDCNTIDRTYLGSISWETYFMCISIVYSVLQHSHCHFWECFVWLIINPCFNRLTSRATHIIFMWASFIVTKFWRWWSTFGPRCGIFI